MPADGTLDERYDFALLGTSLPLSILSAALSRAGYSILHVDDAEHYGGPWASLTLAELTRRCQNKNEGGIRDMMIEFAGDTHENIPLVLQQVNRHFAISLAPTLLPCSGPTIEVLIRARVANYCTFRLLQQTVVCYKSSSETEEEWKLRNVPSSKEDIFKDKTLGLVEKRKLMKLLQQAMPNMEGDDGQQASSSKSVVSPTEDSSDQPFFDYLTSRPHSFSEQLASDVAYGVALCASSSDTTSDAMQRVRNHISSVGRYGNSAYLVGQYGGAGEMAQCYCRASAVQGGTFVLAHGVRTLHKVKAAGDPPSMKGDEWEIALESIKGTSKVGCIVGDENMLAKILRKEQASAESRASASQGRQAFGILLLDRGMNLGASSVSSDAQTSDQQPSVPPAAPPETALVIFPPSSQVAQKSCGAVWALQMGEGTFSCPKGTYLVYLHGALVQSSDDLQSAEDAKAFLRHARDGVLHLASRSAREWTQGQSEDAELRPLFECYGVREASSSNASDQNRAVGSAHEQQRQSLQRDSILTVSSCLNNMATALGDATMQAEDLYWLLCGTSEDERRRDAASVRRDAAAARKREQRANAGQNPVGRGLAGTIIDSTSTTSKFEASHIVCDFFPATDLAVEDN